MSNSVKDSFLFEYDNGLMSIYEVDIDKKEKRKVVQRHINKPISENCDTASVGVGEWRDYSPQKKPKKSGYPSEKTSLSLDYIFNTEDYYEPDEKEIIVGSDEKENPLAAKSRKNGKKPFTTIHNI
jgi:hypothetical protein